MKWLHKNLVGNANMMTSSWYIDMCLSLNSQKKCDIQWLYSFCCKWVNWWRCVICPQHVTTDLAFLFFIFGNVSNLLIPTTNSYYNAVLWGLKGGEPPKKKCYHHHNGNKFSHPLWQQFLLHSTNIAVMAALMGTLLQKWGENWKFTFEGKILD